MKFIDLFSGLGSFHVALENQGHECVFASEIDSVLSENYFYNFGVKPFGDIKKIDKKNEIPKHDILCAGFPCQPFSKAGKQEGMLDYERGSLFDDIIDILEIHRPKYFILENVRNLYSHDKNKTFRYIESKLIDLGYQIDKKILSPHLFGIPQHRERLFIVGSLGGLNGFNWDFKNENKLSVYDIIESSPSEAIPLEIEKVNVLKVWQDFLDIFPKNKDIVRPLWSMEWGASYPFVDSTPHSTVKHNLISYKGRFGQQLSGTTKKEIFEGLPNYAKKKQKKFPKWKINIIRRNRDFYEEYKSIIDPYIKNIKLLGVESWQKLEWNVGISSNRNIYDYLIQFRGSGVRVKRTDYFPSLVTVPTQVPIIGWEKRYITSNEALKLQSLHDIKLPNQTSPKFKAIGNSVNVRLVENIAKNLIS